MTCSISDQIGPNSRLELYQLYFKAPGISHACNALSTVQKPDENLEFHITMEPIRFISGLQVFLVFFLMNDSFN